MQAERPGVTDLYFVAAGGWAEQDVFYREARAAKDLLDDRFGTRGRSLLLANDPSVNDVPVAANVTLRHALTTIGTQMNPEEDVLFLFVTSHGSTDGLDLTFGARAGFRDEVLRPGELKAILDDAGIRWRVLLIAGCDSGVFIEPLRDEHTLVATASASDRPSYGCAAGRAFTDFGRAVFAEELPRQTSFVTAFEQAAATIRRREAESGVLASRPQIATGALVNRKLLELEARSFPR